MTTGTDYITEYISLRPDENTRSIVELCEEERKNGYSDMSDIEISNLIKYKEYKATQAKELEILERDLEEKRRIMDENLQKESEKIDKMMEESLKREVVFKTVEVGV